MPTPAEVRLWALLRGDNLQGISFRRQHAIGGYVVDFCSPRHRLVIELDGRPHVAHRDAEAERTRALQADGYQVLRFWNDQVMNDIQGVAQAILRALKEE